MNIDLYDIEEDFDLIYGEYEQKFDFYEDFYNISYYLFDLKVMSLEKFSETLSQRFQILTGAKVDKNLKKQYIKSLNNKQKEYLEETTKKNIIDMKNRQIDKEIKELFANKKKGGEKWQM